MKLKKREIIKDSNGKNIYQIFITIYDFNLYDFNSNSVITVYRQIMYVLTSTKLLDKANGVLIDGLNGSSSNAANNE